MNNYATHEYWAADGKGFYYCSHGDEYGVIYLRPWPAGRHRTSGAGSCGPMRP